MSFSMRHYAGLFKSVLYYPYYDIPHIFSQSMRAGPLSVVTQKIYTLLT